MRNAMHEANAASRLRNLVDDWQPTALHPAYLDHPHPNLYQVDCCIPRTAEMRLRQAAGHLPRFYVPLCATGTCHDSRSRGRHVEWQIPTLKTQGCNVCPAHREAAVQKAEASKINVVKAAEAESEAKFLQGQVEFHILKSVNFPAEACFW